LVTLAFVFVFVWLEIRITHISILAEPVLFIYDQQVKLDRQIWSFELHRPLFFC
jgi:hypothetical protein